MRQIQGTFLLFQVVFTKAARIRGPVEYCLHDNIVFFRKGQQSKILFHIQPGFTQDHHLENVAGGGALFHEQEPLALKVADTAYRAVLSGDDDPPEPRTRFEFRGQRQGLKQQVLFQLDVDQGICEPNIDLTRPDSGLERIETPGYHQTHFFSCFPAQIEGKGIEHVIELDSA